MSLSAGKAEKQPAPLPGGSKAAGSRIAGNRFWIILNTVFTAIYLWWRFRHSLPLEYGAISIAVGVSLLTVELFGAIEALVHYYNMYRIETHPTPDVPTELFPEVDVFIATYSEPAELLYKTVNGCLHMDYPDKSKVHIHLCDDGRRGEIREMAERMGVNYIDRPDNKGAKAGNLNNAMSVTSAPLIATFDADMIPKHDFLMKCVPYFVDAEIKNRYLPEKKKLKIGFIQTPQSFYNPDLFQFNFFLETRIPNEQDYFYKDIQVSRNKTNSVIYGGSNTLLSRAAINDVGGFFTGAITEDFATGILMQKKKYTCYAINEVLASGLSPTDLPSLIQQRVRWARGCISTGRIMHILLTPKLSLGQKANYWASVWYWYTPIKQLVYVTSPIIFACFGYIVVKCTLSDVLMFWLPMYISANIALKRLSRNIRTTKWTRIYETVLFPFMLFPVLAESFGISLKKFKITKKEKNVGVREKNTAYLAPFAVLTFLSLISVARCIWMILDSGSTSPLIVLFWLLGNLFNLVMAMFFVSGRQIVRNAERVYAQEDCKLKTEAGGIIRCVTRDISETGVAVAISFPVDIDEDETVQITIETDRYKARLKAKLSNVDRESDGWKYAFQITDTCGAYDDYLQILYDRVNTLPSTLHDSVSSFDDLRMNLTRRQNETVYMNRKYPRIEIDETVPGGDGKSYHVINYNYKFILLDGGGLPDRLSLHPADGLSLQCAYECDVYGGKRLYAVENYVGLRYNAKARKLLSDWLTEASLRKQANDNTVDSGEHGYSSLVEDILGVAREETGYANW